MKKLVLLVAAVLVAATSFAQLQADSKLIKADIGFGGLGLPIGVSYEQGILELNGAIVTVGGYLGYAAETEEYKALGYEWKLSQLLIMVQGNYYLKPMVDKLDLYAGIRLGYAGISSKYKYSNGTERDYDYGSPFAYCVHVGANYWFTDNFGINAELGYGIAYANIGVGYKF